jgi:hypothetical protein
MACFAGRSPRRILRRVASKLICKLNKDSDTRRGKWPTFDDFAVYRKLASQEEP